MIFPDNTDKEARIVDTIWKQQAIYYSAVSVSVFSVLWLLHDEMSL